MNLVLLWSRIIYHTVTQRNRHRRRETSSGKEEDMDICPKCGKEYSEPPALSRADNQTKICPLCGTKEALDAIGLTEGSSVREAILESIHRKQEVLG